MFLAHPFFGVGIDRYLAHLKGYIDVDYWVRYGPNRTTDNAHNVVIQIFATGGVFAGLAYLSLIIFIFWRGLIALQRADRKIEHLYQSFSDLGSLIKRNRWFL